MRIAYLSIDEVNQYHARLWADKVGHRLDLWFPRDGDPHADHDAVVYDLDYLPTELAQAILTRLLTEPVKVVVAVHSYNLHGEMLEALRARGVLVHRRLDAVLPGLSGRLASGDDTALMAAPPTVILGHDQQVWLAQAHQ